MVWPQEGWLGGVPSPRKLRDASAMMTRPISTVAITMSGATIDGMMWRVSCRGAVAPMALAAVTNSCSLVLRTAAREMRANTTQRVRARVMMTLITLGPITAAIMMAKMIDGK